MKTGWLRARMESGIANGRNAWVNRILFVAAQILKPLAERLTERADAEGAKVISQRRVYR